MYYTVLMVCLLVSAGVAYPGGHGGYGGHGGGHGGGYHHVPLPYRYSYGVSAKHTNFGQSEWGDGHGNVGGGYWVNLPDGRVQKVSYWAGKGGYFPVVSYAGHARYPAGKGHGGYGHHGHGHHG